MARINDLKVNIDIDTRDLQIDCLKAQNELLRFQLEQGKNETGIDVKQKLDRLKDEEYEQSLIDAYKRRYGHEPISVSHGYDTSTMSIEDINPPIDREVTFHDIAR